MKKTQKLFRIGEDEKAIFAHLTDQFDFDNDTDVLRQALVMLYGNTLKAEYATSEKRNLMTLDEFIAHELYIAKKKYTRDAKQSK